jgi:hypothetical protein
MKKLVSLDHKLTYVPFTQYLYVPCNQIVSKQPDLGKKHAHQKKKFGGLIIPFHANSGTRIDNIFDKVRKYHITKLRGPRRPIKQ